MRRLIFLIIWFIPVIGLAGWFYSGPFGKIYQIKPLSDSEFLGSGYIDENENKYFYLFKIDLQGNILWSNYYGSIFYEQICKDFEITSDSGILMIGTRTPDHKSSLDIYLVKTDLYGDTIWAKIYEDSSSYDEVYSVTGNSSGDYVIVGSTREKINNYCNAYILKIDNYGDTVWTRTYGHHDTNDYFVDIIKTGDHGYIICGYSRIDFYSKIFLTKINETGDPLWTKVLTEGGVNHISEIQELSGQGYVIIGYTSAHGAGGNDIYVIRTDYYGNTCWTGIYGWGTDDNGYSIDQTSDGGLILTGSTRRDGTTDIFIMKIDSLGRKLWDKTYGSTFHIDEGLTIKNLNNDGFLVSGYYDYYSWYWPTEKIFVLRTDSLGVAVEENIFSSPQQNYFSVISSGNLQAQISFSLVQSGQVRVEVYDLSGRRVDTPGEGFYPAGEHYIYWLVPRAGVYFFRISSNCLEQSTKALML